jgi:DNA-binding CsgD family transcriptional regulator
MAPVTENRTTHFKGGIAPFSFPVERLTESILALSDAAVLVTYGTSIHYCTQSIISVLGIAREGVMEQGWPQLIDLMHPSDSRLLRKKLMPEIRRYFKNLPENERHHHTFNFTLRMRIGDCHYGQIAVENRPLKWASKKNWPTAYVTILRDISPFADKGATVLNIYQHNESKTYKKVYTKNYSVAVSTFSARETEIIRHIAHGLTSYQIAEVLCISPETVRNHRKKIMRKAACKSSSGLMRLALDEGII